MDDHKIVLKLMVGGYPHFRKPHETLVILSWSPVPKVRDKNGARPDRASAAQIAPSSCWSCWSQTSPASEVARGSSRWPQKSWSLHRLTWRSTLWAWCRSQNVGPHFRNPLHSPGVFLGGGIILGFLREKCGNPKASSSFPDPSVAQSEELIPQMTPSQSKM